MHKSNQKKKNKKKNRRKEGTRTCEWKKAKKQKLKKGKKNKYVYTNAFVWRECFFNFIVQIRSPQPYESLDNREDWHYLQWQCHTYAVSSREFVQRASITKLDETIISIFEPLARAVTFEPMTRATDLQVRPHLLATSPIHLSRPVHRIHEHTLCRSGAFGAETSALAY